jgi:hypothetical protein
MLDDLLVSRTRVRSNDKFYKMTRKVRVAIFYTFSASTMLWTALMLARELRGF